MVCVSPKHLIPFLWTQFHLKVGVHIPLCYIHCLQGGGYQDEM